MDFEGTITEECDNTLFTEYGELRFYEKPKPKFVFFNPRAKKQDLVCYSSTIRAIANHLQDAQSAARRYLAANEEKLSVGISSNIEQDGSSSSTGQDVKTDVGKETDVKNDDIIFSQLVSQYGREILIKNYLLVNIYNERPRIWLKPWWRDTKDGTNASWLPSSAGFQFSLFDTARSLVAFSDKCMTKSRREVGSLRIAMPAVDVITVDPEFDNLVVQLMEMEDTPPTKDKDEEKIEEKEVQTTKKRAAEIDSEEPVKMKRIRRRIGGDNV